MKASLGFSLVTFLLFASGASADTCPQSSDNQASVRLSDGAMSHDVEAGPIWNNDDAKLKCPTICSNDNSTWNGQWTTTIPNKQSVCGCVANEE